MIVCICHNVSDKAIRSAVADGAGTLQAVRAQLNVGSCCGKCLPCAKTLVRACVEDAQLQSTELRRDTVAA